MFLAGLTCKKSNAEIPDYFLSQSSGSVYLKRWLVLGVRQLIDASTSGVPFLPLKFDLPGFDLLRFLLLLPWCTHGILLLQV